MLRSTKRFAVPSDELETVTALDKSPDRIDRAMRGWFRLRISVANENLQRVSISAENELGHTTAFEMVCAKEQFRAYIFLARSIRRVTVRVGKLELRPDQVSIELRPISLAEYMWKSRRLGSLRKPHKFIGFFRDPVDEFLVSFEYPVPQRGRGDYKTWMSAIEEDYSRQYRESSVRVMNERPQVGILMTVCDPRPLYLKKALESVLGQTSPNWRLSIADDASVNPEIRDLLQSYRSRDKRIHLALRTQRGGISAATNEAFGHSASPVVTCFDHDDTLADIAVEVVARHFGEKPDCRILFSDEDKIDARDSRFEPYFKPREFSPELFFSYNYINHLTAHRADTVRDIGGWRSEFDGAQDYDLTLRSLKRMDLRAIHHIPLVLYHWRAIAGSAALSLSYKPYAIEKGLQALQSYFADQPHVRVGVTSDTLYRIERRLGADAPGVAILVPFRDRADLLAVCAESILSRTDYPDIELILIDNGSTEPETLALIDRLRSDPRVRVIVDPSSFNYSRLNNLGARAASKEFLCLLNNDIEVLDGGWLRDMVGYALDPEIGCVGAKLLYPAGSIQHAGVVLGLGGVAGHSFLNKNPDEAGYFGRLLVASNYSAVTGACLLLRREVFEEVGGLDETDLQVAFNDIDLCVKVQQSGRRNVFTPFARLMHHESASRGADASPEKAARFRQEALKMQERYGSYLQNDPWYSPHLSLRHDFFVRET